MSLNDLFKLTGGVAFIALSLIQISPIKINPWSWLARAFGRAINGDMLEKMDSLEKKLHEIDERQEQNNVIASRIRILRFGDEMQCGILHSREHFKQILADIEIYDDYCDTHPDFKNEVTKETARYIKEVYRKHLRTHIFLRPKELDEADGDDAQQGGDAEL